MSIAEGCYNKGNVASLQMRKA